jgi:hypothetical protein
MSTNRPTVAILGIGPSALAIAHAVWINTGKKPTFFSVNSNKSGLYGCQYLHDELPLIAAPSTRINYKLDGTIGDYSVKVYGPNWNGAVSPSNLQGIQTAFDIRATYNRLWEDYIAHRPEMLYIWDIDGRDLMEREAELRDRFDLIISTIPATALCLRRGEHKFASREIWAMGDSPYQKVPFRDGFPNNTVRCNGMRYPGWYRMSRIFGHTTVEWPGAGKKPPFEGVRRIAKPLWSDCDCLPWVERLGRYGAWMKGILVTDVFEQASLRIKNETQQTVLTDRGDWCLRCGRIAVRMQQIGSPKDLQYFCQGGHSWETSDGKFIDQSSSSLQEEAE